MRQIKITLLAMVLVAVVAACNFSGNKKKEVVGPQPFPYLPTATMGDPEANIINETEHFWNRFFDTTRVYSKDSLLVKGVTVKSISDAFTQYAMRLQIIPLKNVLKAQSNLMALVEADQKRNPESNIYKNFLEINADFLFDVQSQFRSEDAYIPVLESAIRNCADSVQKETYLYDLSVCSMNRIGAIANDFTYATNKGKKGTLHKISSEYTIILFSNPGCNACEQIIRYMSDPQMKIIFAQTKTTVLNIYPDEDLAEWYEYMPIYPEEWINGYNPNAEIKIEKKFSLRAIPSLYLLDKEKKVIYKDAEIEMIMRYLAGKSSQSIR